MLKTVSLLFLIMACFPFDTAAQNAVKGESRGAYLAKLGDCTSCHTVRGQPPFSGGFKVNSPVGPIFGANITPDPEYGIGRYSLKEFSRAVRRGIARDGTLLYPAMPYPDFARITDDDIKALYDYFMHEVPPVHKKVPETQLPFPFNQRWGIRFWNWLFAGGKPYTPDSSRSKQWNRGAYLVQSLGHCGSCHTPRGLAYQQKAMSESSSRFLSGGLLDNWYAPSLKGDPISGLGRWSEDDIAAFLATGHGAGTIVFGNMRQVVENSGQYMTPQDRKAIAHYLKSLSAEDNTQWPEVSEKPIPFELPGAGLYASACASCHGKDGEGKWPKAPKLADNSAVLSDNPTSIIRIILEGALPPQTEHGPKSGKMPGFGKRLSDLEIARATTFIRQSWGNHAPSVTRRQVEALRAALHKQPQ